MSKKLTESETIAFVKAYERHECLWNFRSLDYKNKNARTASLLAMGKQFGMTIEEVKNKIRIIRSTYSQERAKVNNSYKSGASGDEIYKPNLVWYNLGNRFLEKVVYARKGINNLGCPSGEKSQLDTILSDIEVKNEIIEPEQVIGSDEISQGIYCHSSEAWEEPATNVPDETPGPSKRIRLHEQESARESTEILPVIKNAEDTGKDEFYHFGMNVASQLRNLPLANALLCQMKLLEILTSERLQHQNGYGSYPARPQSALSKVSADISEISAENN